MQPEPVRARWDVDRDTRTRRLRWWQHLLVRMMVAADYFVKTALRLEASLMLSQRSAAIAVRCLSPTLVRLLTKTLGPSRRGDSFMARTNIGAEASASTTLDPERCSHQNLEAYANAHGRFRSCLQCRKRWKAVGGRGSAEAWIEHGFKPVPGTPYRSSSQQSAHASQPPAVPSCPVCQSATRLVIEGSQGRMTGQDR